MGARAYSKAIRENKLLVLLGLNLLIFTSLFFILAFTYPQERDIFISLATSTLTIGITVFFVDRIIKANQKAQWENAEKVASDEVSTLAIELVSRVVVPLSIPFMKEWLDKVNEFVGRDTYLKDITDWDMQKVEELGIANLFNQLTDDGWRGFYKGVQRLEADLRDCIVLYSNILPPKILGSLLDFNKDFKDDYSLFGNSLGLYVQQLGTGMKAQTKEAFVSHFTKDLAAYFDKVKSFRKQLEALKWI